MKTRTVDYSHAGAALKGHLAYDETKAGRRPAVLVCHAWAGRDAFALAKAERLAGLGYAGFALDVYGGARQGSSKEENSALMTPFIKDRGLLYGRLRAAVDAVKALAEVDPERIAAIGFCFGGLCALDLARGGAGLRGVVSFHGLLGPSCLPAKKISAKVLALHGFDDPMATPDQLLAFAKEMTEAGADWQVHAYGQTMHAFTNPQADDPGFGTVYRKEADERSWKAMECFLAEILR